MSTSNVCAVGSRRFIAIAVDETNGCDGCAAWQAGPINLCHKLPKCSGHNFSVIFQELDD